MLLAGEAYAENSKQRAERLMSARVGSILPHWYQPTSKVVCVNYFKNDITSSTFNLTTRDTHTGESNNLVIYCDDMPDLHQCGWGVRH